MPTTKFAGRRAFCVAGLAKSLLIRENFHNGRMGGCLKGIFGGLIVARSGTGYFDRKGHFFKTPRDATASDLAALLGQIGEGESLAPGIAHMLLERRTEIEQLFAEHDAMVAEKAAMAELKVGELDAKVSKLPSRPTG